MGYKRRFSVFPLILCAFLLVDAFQNRDLGSALLNACLLIANLNLCLTKKVTIQSLLFSSTGIMLAMGIGLVQSIVRYSKPVVVGVSRSTLLLSCITHSFLFLIGLISFIAAININKFIQEEGEDEDNVVKGVLYAPFLTEKELSMICDRFSNSENHGFTCDSMNIETETIALENGEVSEKLKTLTFVWDFDLTDEERTLAEHLWAEMFEFFDEIPLVDLFKKEKSNDEDKMWMRIKKKDGITICYDDYDLADEWYSAMSLSTVTRKDTVPVESVISYIQDHDDDFFFLERKGDTMSIYAAKSNEEIERKIRFEYFKETE